MISEAQIKSVALFFSFAFLEDQLARQATLTTVYRLKKDAEWEKSSEDQRQVKTVVACTKVWTNYSKHFSKKISLHTSGLNTLKDQFTDIGPWREFRKLADSDEFLAVLWSQIIGFNNKNVAKALNTSEGTLRHRIGRGLRVLGNRMI